MILKVCSVNGCGMSCDFIIVSCDLQGVSCVVQFVLLA